MSLRKWFDKERWVDIGAPKSGGGFEECGRKSTKDSKRAYPKCVPAKKAASMTAQPQGVGGKPTNVKTFASNGGFIMKYNKGCGKVMPDRRKKTRYS